MSNMAPVSLLDCLGVNDDPHPRGRMLAERAHGAIPGGAHTYAKGDDQYPWLAPPMLVRGQGCHVWDADGHAYIEYGMGLRAITLGHAEPRLIGAAAQAMSHGINFVRPSPLELEYAEELIAEIPAAEMVKFAKNGSDVTTAAVKLARAYTGRELIALCADHPFFSTDDWFIGVTDCDAGIPQNVQQQTLKFPYGDLAAVQRLFDEHPNEIACLMMEVETTQPPQAEYLQGMKSLAEKHGALLIFDEIITGFRWSLGGAQSVYGVTPHLATFGKAIANGFALAALVGQREFMERGGLRHKHPRVFLLSTTAGAERHTLAIARETIAIYKQEPVVDVLHKRGAQLRDGVNSLVAKHGVGDCFELMGRNCNLIFVAKDQQGNRSQVFRALFMQELVRRGVLAPSFVVSYAHSTEDIQRTLEAVDGALHVYAKALESGADRFLLGPPVKPVMRKFN